MKKCGSHLVQSIFGPRNRPARGCETRSQVGLTLGDTKYSTGKHAVCG